MRRNRLVEDAVRRHEAGALGAYIVFDADGARRQAAEVDRAVSRGRDPGPLAGITVSVKDLYGVDGLPIRAGTKRELPVEWRREGFLVRALRRLGAVIVGKTHTVELAFGGVGLNPNTGTPVNPWDDEGAPGAGRIVLGSGRQSLGRVRPDRARERHRRLGADSRSGHRGCRTPANDGAVADDRRRAAVDNAGHGGPPHTHGRRLTVRLRGHRSTGRIQASSRIRWLRGYPAIAGLRIGIPRQGLWQESDAGIAAVARAALAELETGGAEILEIDAPELREAGERYLAGELVQPERAESLERHLPGWTSILDPTVGKRLESAHAVSAVDYVAILRLRRRLSARLHARMEADKVELLATPTLPITPPPLSALAELDAYRAVNRDMLYGTGPASMLDMCAVSLPAGLDDHGMPVGLQLIGQTGTDHALLARAVAAEAVLGTNLERLGVPPRVA